ncbi:MAG: hypothetical protein OXU19_05135 [bacterium]|nr:hypothetical protein [Rhodospirillaceae bacterium]MDE0045232.1 hypothetical protein [bacterium]
MSFDIELTGRISRCCRGGPEAVYTPTAYAKADCDDLTAADRKALVTAIQRERQE